MDRETKNLLMFLWGMCLGMVFIGTLYNPLIINLIAWDAFLLYSIFLFIFLFNPKGEK